MTGTLISQLVPFVTAPLLTRLYAPSDFGTFALYAAVTSLVAIIITGRYEMAIVLPEQDSDAFNVLALALATALGLSGISALIVIFWGTSLARLIAPDSIRWLSLIPLSALLIGTYNSLIYWMNRKKRFALISTSRVLLSLSIVCVTLAVGMLHFGAMGLVVGSILGQVIAASYLVWHTLKKDRDFRKDVASRAMIAKAKEYQDLPKVNSVHAFSDVVQSSSVSFLLSSFYGEVVLGLYAFSIRVVSAPLGIIGSSISQVFYQRASELHVQGRDLHGLFRDTIRRLITITLPFTFLFILLAPDLFRLFFGERWVTAGHYARLLAPWMFFTFVVSSVSQLPIILNKQKTMFLISLLGNSLILGSILFGIYVSQNISHGFIALSALLSIYFIGLLMWYDTITRQRVLTSFKDR